MNETQNESSGVELSVVIPVSNEEAVLTKLFDRLYPVLDGLGMAYEVVFVDSSSRDRSMTLLRQQYKLRAGVTRVLLLRGNAGRYAAIMAGFEVAVGGRVVTLDADLRTPPPRRFLGSWPRWIGGTTTWAAFAAGIGTASGRIGSPGP